LYIRLLDEQGFAHSRRGDIEMLKTAIQLRYPARLLSLLRADFMHPYGDDWLWALVFRQAQIHSPVHHVLFINFLGYRVDHFLLQLLDLEGDGHEMSENHSLL